MTDDNDFYKLATWRADYARIKQEIPTILRLLGEAWLDSQTSDFLEETTHQNQCHPLLSILVNCGNGRRGIEAPALEALFASLEAAFSREKLANLRGARSWQEFTATFAELLLAGRLSREGRIELEPDGPTTSRPDMAWTVDGIRVGIEVSTVTETDKQQKSKREFQDELDDAGKMSRLVEEYRRLKTTGEPLPRPIRRRLREIKELDELWEEPTPRVFGGAVPIASRFPNQRAAIDDLIGRKSGGRQLAGFEYRILALFLPRDYFHYPIDFRRLTEVEHHDEKYKCAGKVYHAFYGRRGDLLYARHFARWPDSRVRERMEQDGRFRKKTSFSAAILCSIGTMLMDGAWEVPISPNFAVYEPLGPNARLLPGQALEALTRVLQPSAELSVFASRTGGGGDAVEPPPSNHHGLTRENGD